MFNLIVSNYTKIITIIFKNETIFWDKLKIEEPFFWDGVSTNFVLGLIWICVFLPLLTKRPILLWVYVQFVLLDLVYIGFLSFSPRIKKERKKERNMHTIL